MIIVKKIEGSHWPSIMKIQNECYFDLKPESFYALESRWKLSRESCFIVGKDEVVMGYAISHSWYDNIVPQLDKVLDHLPQSNLLYIHDIAISKNSRGTGAADSLLKAIFAYSKRIGFSQAALVAVQKSVKFWERYGFSTVKDSGSLIEYGVSASYMKRGFT